MDVFLLLSASISIGDPLFHYSGFCADQWHVFNQLIYAFCCLVACSKYFVYSSIFISAAMFCVLRLFSVPFLLHLVCVCVFVPAL
jgi:hypothetical protein